MQKGVCSKKLQPLEQIGITAFILLQFYRPLAGSQAAAKKGACSKKLQPLEQMGFIAFILLQYYRPLVEAQAATL